VISTIIGALFGFFAAVFAEPLRHLIYRPKLRLEFGNTSDYRARTPEQATPSGTPDFSGWEADYIRIKVTNTKPAVAKNCRAYLVAVEKADETGQFIPTKYCDSIPLSWACRGDQAYDPLDLPRDIPHFVDVVSTRSVSTDFRPEIRPVPYRYVSLFGEHGTFRFTILVSGENIKPTPIRVFFRWAGVWDKYETWLDNTC
jgi:hypothetical protein